MVKLKKIELARWANIAEIFASIVLVLTLVYVGLELDRNTKAAQSGSWQGIINKMNDLDTSEAADPEFSSVIMRGENTPQELSDAELFRFYRMAQARLGQLEFAYLALNEGTIGEYHWGAVKGYIQQMIWMPGYRSFWDEYGEAVYHEDFVAHIQSVLPNCESKEETAGNAVAEGK
ncbi:MAG TPA: hypothetical protein DCW52_08880 [Gammaproteobacteria bacterium]|jgi:hypothetical protein|nr:hypothetical protein [Gammaproteobacteria bacterium]